jgi:type II secretory pathway pseudopilin PulG
VSARSNQPNRGESGAILIIFMVALVVAAIALGATVQAWSKTWRRDTEEELIFRGNQYVDAIIAYRKEHGGQFPTRLEDLYKPGPRRLRYIRHLYREPFGKNGRWGLLYLMPGGQGVYDPAAAQKAQDKAAKEFGSKWETAGTGELAQPELPGGVTQVDTQGIGVAPGAGGAPGAPGMPPGFQGNLPPIPSEEANGAEGEEPISEPPIGWPIVGVISRATGKVAQDTFRIYKGHEHVDEWQFHVFDRGEQVPTPGTPGMAPAPMGLGPGVGGKYRIQMNRPWDAIQPRGGRKQQYPDQPKQQGDKP